ncbi:spore maturation protein [Thermoclostridium caenicola]|uniref:Spore maturation protein B n=1 Tax=Thermoclostridium caenicola TaxID=659425 RepID=A0A1M6C5N1_9FIRM|nr:nucleoside recognition domain-containing protein [Thermoclostridium caenicola]SHI56054.1 spore maturation protein B [Thermoclostridium caenicola]HOP72500.1 spore maturation protein [Thermoclostridium caenicola]
MMDFLSNAAIPAVVLLIVVTAYIRGVPVFDAFVEGAKEGARTAFDILPVMVGILAGVAVLNGSGLIDMLTGLLQKPAEAIGIPREILPLLLIRPFSGSASLGLFSEQITRVGPDTFLGRALSTIMGSSETVLYTLAVYFGAANVKNTRHAVAASLISSYAGMLAAIFICRIIE